VGGLTSSYEWISCRLRAKTINLELKAAAAIGLRDGIVT
jgi:hypothetical protein